METNTKQIIVDEYIKRLSFSNSCKLAYEYAEKCHRSTNHRYDDLPYTEGHLTPVVQYAKKYIDVLIDAFPGITYDEIELAVASGWTHDTIEDTRQTLNDVRKICGHTIALITYALSNEKGMTRKERANAKYYKGIRRTHFATYIKVCDRLANVRHSYLKTPNISQTVMRKPSMLDMYRNEHVDFINKLKPTWLEQLVNLYETFVGRKPAYDGMALFKAMKPMFELLEYMLYSKE